MRWVKWVTRRVSFFSFFLHLSPFFLSLLSSSSFYPSLLSPPLPRRSLSLLRVYKIYIYVVYACMYVCVQPGATLTPCRSTSGSCPPWLVRALQRQAKQRDVDRGNHYVMFNDALTESDSVKLSSKSCLLSSMRLMVIVMVVRSSIIYRSRV